MVLLITKLFSLLSVICAVQSNHVPPSVLSSWKTLIAPHVDQCIEETKIDREVAKSAFMNSTPPDKVVFGCYFKCIDEKLGFLLPGGQYNKQVMVEKINHLTDKMADKCIAKTKSESDDCHKVYNMAHCIIFEVEYE
ncbi:hypothetical protein FQA39_LY14610 [Lamprigera yunnana]|nr:hypothetical protein FQA39_LY14610 [Lamprigera yunnana]